jgi:hypothetical protein
VTVRGHEARQPRNRIRSAEPTGKALGSAGHQSAEQYARRQIFSLPLRRLRQGSLLPSPYIYPSTLEAGKRGGTNVQRTCAGVPPLGIRKSCMR